MDGWRAVLGPADVHAAVVELDLVPLQIAHLRGSQSMTIGDQDHGGAQRHLTVQFTMVEAIGLLPAKPLI
jgi:hypothetical protein